MCHVTRWPHAFLKGARATACPPCLRRENATELALRKSIKGRKERQTCRPALRPELILDRPPCFFSLPSYFSPLRALSQLLWTDSTSFQDPHRFAPSTLDVFCHLRRTGKLGPYKRAAIAVPAHPAPTEIHFTTPQKGHGLSDLSAHHVPSQRLHHLLSPSTAPVWKRVAHPGDPAFANGDIADHEARHRGDQLCRGWLR